MTLWILALSLLTGLGWAGHFYGAIRAAISIVGLLTAAALAVPLAPTLKPVLEAAGLHPLLHGVVAPAAVFFVILTVLKITGMVVDRKVDLYYKYKVDDLGRARWERLNKRLGLCLGLCNGTIYLFLILLPIYILSYATAQLSPMAENTPALLRLLNKAGEDLRSTRLYRAVAAIDPMPADYYDLADIAGVIYHNPLVQGRLSRYPRFLALGDRPEFEAIATDVGFNNLVQAQPPVLELLRHPRLRAILDNPDLVAELRGADLKDLRQHLETGTSAKFGDEKILGRWFIDINATLVLEKKAKPNISAQDLNRMKRLFETALAGFTFTALPDNKAVFKMPPLADALLRGGASRPEPERPATKVEGEWKNVGGSYQLSFSLPNGKTEPADVALAGDKLTLRAKQGAGMVLRRED